MFWVHVTCETLMIFHYYRHYTEDALNAAKVVRFNIFGIAFQLFIVICGLYFQCYYYISAFSSQSNFFDAISKKFRLTVVVVDKSMLV